MNLPNQLTVGRFFITLLFVASLSITWRFSNTLGLLLFAVASITDYADGYIARNWQLETDFGRLMDPLVDKIMLASAFICLVEDHVFAAWVAVIIISREFLITGLRTLAASKGVVLPAENLGKHKTIWQIVSVLFFLTFAALKEIFGPTVGGFEWWWQLAHRYLGAALIVVVIVLTVLSGLGYLWRNRTLITQY